MKAAHEILFRPFRLDIENEMLWRGSHVLALRQKSFALLRYLAEHPGQLVLKEELLHAVWPETRVSDIVLKVCIREVRQVLGDQPQAPAFIETVQRRGYRFIRPVRQQLPSHTRRARRPRNLTQEASVTATADTPLPAPLLAQLPASHGSPLDALVGRQTALQQLQDWLTKALCGERQIVFVTGEPGIGKTALLDAFLSSLATKPAIWIARGQCIAHYGEGEAYLPVIEAFSRLCREPGHERLVPLLNRYAPLWLAQMPSLLSPQERVRLQREMRGATQERLLREMADAIEALTADTPLILVLEDLHWSDPATLDLLSFLGRQEPARLLILGAYRPEKISASAHPLKRVKHELHTHGRCQHLPLTLLTAEDVAHYLTLRHAPSALPPALAQAIHQHTEGNPLFIVNMVEHLVNRGVIAFREGQWRLTTEVNTIQFEESATVQEIIDSQLDRLTPREEQVLRAASVAGAEFTSAVVAATLNAEIDEVEECCDALARRNQFLQSRGPVEWPDGTVTTRYAFIHCLYQHGWYERVTAAKRVHLHLHIGKRLEQGYGERALEVAAELAAHFEHGRETHRAIYYRRQAATHALQRFAYQEAIHHLMAGLHLLSHVAPLQERGALERELRAQLGATRAAREGALSLNGDAASAQVLTLCH